MDPAFRRRVHFPSRDGRGVWATKIPGWGEHASNCVTQDSD